MNKRLERAKPMGVITHVRPILVYENGSSFYNWIWIGLDGFFEQPEPCPSSSWWARFEVSRELGPAGAGAVPSAELSWCRAAVAGLEMRLFHAPVNLDRSGGGVRAAKSEWVLTGIHIQGPHPVAASRIRSVALRANTPPIVGPASMMKSSVYW